ncbi:hypothetical protein EDB89DRAFT_1275967 [Lactarius sanguifluus]|nr:hypothetical protein EDB89DRAFT_1275967 [Lactarius sanguifluus]
MTNVGGICDVRGEARKEHVACDKVRLAIHLDERRVHPAVARSRARPPHEDRRTDEALASGSVGEFSGLLSTRDGEVVLGPHEGGGHVVGRSEGFASLGDRDLCELAQLRYELNGWQFWELGIEAKRAEDGWSRSEHACRRSLQFQGREVALGPASNITLSSHTFERRARVDLLQYLQASQSA